MYFTFSRGAWFALGAGLLAAVAIDPRRLQLIAVGLLLAPWSALAISAADGRAGLTTRGATIQQATTDGHSLVPVLALLAGGAALTALAAGLVERRVRIPSLVRYAFAATVICALLMAPHGSGRRRGHLSPSPNAAGMRFARPRSRIQTRSRATSPLRLLTLSSNGRVNLWHVSLDRFKEAPVLGTGAGTFWQAWAKYRDIPTSTVESHSLYFGTLGGLGIVGLALLALALLVTRYRRVPRARP